MSATQIVSIDPDNVNNELLEQPGKMLRDGKLVAFPTETVYGLGASAFSDDAVRGIFKAKGRPADNPLIVHISDMAMLGMFLSDDEVRMIPPRLMEAMNKFWPGPLTVLLPKGSKISPVVTAGQPLLAVRMPSNEISRQLIRIANVPVAAPSANTSGMPSPTTADHVIHDLMGKISCIVDGGPCLIGVESTVISAMSDPPLILRPGGVSMEELKTVFPDISKLSKQDIEKFHENPPTPGLKYRHYAPCAKSVLIESTNYSSDTIQKDVNRIIQEYVSRNKYVGVIRTQRSIDISGKCRVWDLVGYECEDIVVVSRGLFNALRSLDQEEMDVIVMIGVKEEGRGVAVMNRMRKAATEIIVV